MSPRIESAIDLRAGESAAAETATEARKRRLVDRRSVPFLVFAALVFVAARLWNLTSFGLFGDEVFTLWAAARDWRGLFATVVADVAHPPLFYVLLKVWIDAGGQSLLWIKLLPVLFSTVSIVPFVLLCRELKLEATVIVSGLWLMAVNGFLINHGQEPRMYSLLLLSALCSLWLFARLVRRDANTTKIELALSAINLLAVFTHYYAWVVVGLEFIYVLIAKRERLRSFTISVVFLVLCFSPWVYEVSQAARANPSRVDFVWNRPPPLSDLVGFYANLNGPLSYRWKILGTGVVLLVFVGPIIAWARRVLRTKDQEESTTFWWLALFAFAPPVLAFVASHLLPQSVWSFRYLIIAAPVYLVLVAAAVWRLKARRWKLSLLVVILGWSSLSGLAQVANPDRIAWQPLVHKMMSAEVQRSNVTVYVTDGNVGNTIQFYLDQAGETGFQAVYVNSLDAIEGDRFWLALIRYKHEAGPLPQTTLAERGYAVGQVIESETVGDKAVLFPVWRRR